MSLNNILKNNNYNLKVKSIEADELDFDHVVVNDIIIENAIVNNQVTTPHIVSGTSLFNTIDTVTINSFTTNTNTINSTSTISTPNMNTDTLNSYSGGNISVGYPLVLPNIRPSSLLAYYQYTNGTLNVTGCITTTINYYAVRVGNSITLYLQTSQSFATATATYMISGFPTQFYSNVVPIRGACSVNSSLGPVMGSYTFSTTGVFIVYSGVGGGAFPAGPQCGLNGLSGEYSPFHIIGN